MGSIVVKKVNYHSINAIHRVPTPGVLQPQPPVHSPGHKEGFCGPLQLFEYMFEILVAFNTGKPH